MVKIKFDYDQKKDAWSWVLIAKNRDVWGLNWRDQIAQIPDELLEKIEKVSFSLAQEIVEKYIKDDTNRKYRSKVMQLEIQSLEQSWGMVEKKYFKILSEIMQKPIFSDRFACYFTTGFMCPYNEKEGWFMVSMWHSIPFSITTICHEIMHLQFLHHYKKYLEEKGLSGDQIETLKESLTFLLNEVEFRDIILCNDSGYPEQQKLRNKLQKIWTKEKDFKMFLDEAILEIKNTEKK